MLVELVEFLVLLLLVIYADLGLIRTRAWLWNEVVFVALVEEAGAATESSLLAGRW